MIFYSGRTERGRMCKGAVDACWYDDKSSVGQMIFKGLRFQWFSDVDLKNRLTGCRVYKIICR